MKKKAVILFFSVVTFGSVQLLSMSEGGLNMTGAPGEGNCTGCHAGTANSNTSGSVQISVKGNPTEYVPGQLYEVSVTTSFPGRSRFGFALAARKHGTEFNEIGELSAPDSAGLRGFDYVTHTAASNTGNGSKTWTFNWKAPQSNVGKITLYAAGVAGNQSNSPNGDFVYTSSFVLNQQGSTGGVTIGDKFKAEVYPTIQTNHFYTKFNLKENSHVNITLFNLKGEMAEELMDEQLLAGDYHTLINYKKQHAAGVYLIRTAIGNDMGYTKVVVQ